MNIDDQYCLELLNRAIVQHDTCVREMLQQCLGELLRRWIRSHPKSVVACQLNSEDHYVAQALERFWRITLLHRPEASDFLVLALRYLRASLNSVIMDALRTCLRPQGMAMVEIGEATDPLTEFDATRYTSWEVIEHVFPNTRECRLAYLLFHCGLKPGEIVRSCPLEFSDAQENYHLWPGIIEQLSRIAVPAHNTEPGQSGETESGDHLLPQKLFS